jgi:hypothetical protein
MHLAEFINYPHTCDTALEKFDIEVWVVTSPFIEGTW